ncbi:MAG: tetratricopeptide repeat protein [Deltaproteobacteria bacterium]|nr:tetratricopeptide repeat protein [Deltaproteobacteria bacterium]
MAKIKVKPRKKLIDAENPITLWFTVKEYVEQNARQIGAIAFAVVVVAAAVFAWSAMKARAERDSLNMFYAAMSTMTAPADSKDPAAQTALYEKALAQFKEVREKHGGTTSGALALLYEGNCAYSLKKYDEAIGYYKEFLDASHGTLQYLRSAGYEGIGYAYESKGDFKQAAEFFEKQKNDSQAEGGGSAALNLARVYELAGDRQKACNQYKEFLEKNPLSGQKQFAQIKADSLCPKKGK